MIAFTKAMKNVLKVHPDYILVLAGRDEINPQTGFPMQEWIQEELKPYSDRVYFKGAITGNEVKYLLSQSEISVVPSLWENYSTVVLEAIASGCTVVTSNRGEISEIINKNVNGILFNPYKAAEINSSLKKI